MMNSSLSSSLVQGNCPTSLSVKDGQGIDPVIDRVRCGGALPDHLKDLLLYLCDFKMQMSWLFQRNQELERKVEEPCAENKKLRENTIASGTASATESDSVPRNSPELIPSIVKQDDPVFDLETQNKIERRRSLVLIGVAEQKSSDIRERIQYDYLSVSMA
ncbi:hypothetical protein Y032_0348g3178 [Ancylostoma ceylanicum]|uniref:Uncharacterized protein n=1 Tax=Ancylostoma ceylanicum TaxID=53326 RepID=A0A016RX47_9BILA|nr:hypothetical protein Y032_0348g3178 [Ancylostoma ceylanicum]